MIKAKLVAVFSAIVAVLAFSAAPAWAEFQSNSTSSKGAMKGTGIILEGGGATLGCISFEGEWTILSGGVPATKGSTLSLNIKKWNGCAAKGAEIKEAATTIKECTIRLTQPAGEVHAKGSVPAECTASAKVIGILTCTLHLPSESGATNKELVKNQLENNGNDLLITMEDTDVTTTVSGFCPGVSGTTEAKIKAHITASGVKEI